MSTGDRIPLAEAARDADAFRALFAGAYERWVVAGSVRRRAPDVGDIEHVVQTQRGEVRTAGEMFPREAPLVHHQLDAMLAAGTIAKALYGATQATRWGDRLRGVVWRGRRHEIFFGDDRNFYAQLVIRTGPAGFSEALVTRMRAIGLYSQGGDTEATRGYVASQRDGSIRTVTSEEDYFGLCGTPYIPPEGRRNPA